MNIEEKILKYNKQIQEDEKQKAIIESKTSAILDKLKNEYKLEESNLDLILEQLYNDCDNLHNEIEKDLKQLENNYDWDVD